VNDFLTRAARYDLTTASGARVLAEETHVRVHTAMCDISDEPSRALEIRQALMDDMAAAPAECLPHALAELRALAAFLINNENVLHGFCHTGVESTTMWDELASLVSNPYRYAAGRCDHAGAPLERLQAVAGLVMVLVMTWPAEENGCPVCCFVVEEHGPEDFVLPPRPSAVQSV
jgi:hypothetical protein